MNESETAQKDEQGMKMKMADMADGAVVVVAVFLLFVLSLVMMMVLCSNTIWIVVCY